MPRGRPASVERIVDTNDIIEPNDILNEQWKLITLVQIQPVQWLAKRGLISNTIRCVTCSVNRNFIRRGDNIDGFQWKCRSCNLRKSIRTNSFFSGSHLSLSKLVLLLYCWAYDYSLQFTAQECDLQQNGHTIIDWFNSCRDACCQYIRDYHPEIGGYNLQTGEPIVVEIDVTTFFKPTPNDKKRMKGYWVLGGIERGTGKCFLVPIEYQNKDAFKAAIVRCILPGTHIISDLWAEYLQIDQIQQGVYTHEYIDHDHPSDPEIHTRHMDRMWLRVKTKLRRKHVTSDKIAFQSFLTEFVWRSHFKNTDKFAALIYSLKHLYKV